MFSTQGQGKTMMGAASSVLPRVPDATDTGNDVFSSTHPSLLNFSTAGDMKVHFQHLRDSKERQLQQAGSLGQRVLAQQMELEERIKQIQDVMVGGRDEEVEIQERYRQLADTLLVWDEENATLSSAFGSGAKRLNGTSRSPTLRAYDLLTPEKPEPECTKRPIGTVGTAGPSSYAARSRRAKNVAHRADDVELAFEIGSGLLTEVRRLSSLLGERDKTIRDIKEEKDDLERMVESQRATIKQNDTMNEELRSTNLDLEASLHNLQSMLSDSQSSNHLLESEIKRLTTQFSPDRDASDNFKTESEKLRNTTEELKVKHEFEISQAANDWEWL